MTCLIWFWTVAALIVAVVHHLARMRRPQAAEPPAAPTLPPALRQALADLDTCEAIWAATIRQGESQ